LYIILHSRARYSDIACSLEKRWANEGSCGLRQRVWKHGSVASSGGDLYVTPTMPLVPFGSDRAAIAGSYRIIITSCWNAPGLNHKPPAIPLEMAVCSRFMLALMCLSICQPHSHLNSVPIRESCTLPHVGHVLLLFLGATLTIISSLTMTSILFFSGYM